MQKNTTKVLKNSMIYVCMQILQRGILVFLIPFYTRLLSPNDFGIMSVVNSGAAFLSVFYLFSLNGAAFRFYIEFKDDKENLKIFLGTTITSLLLISVVLTTVIFLFGPKLFLLFLGNINFFPYIFLGIIGISFSGIFTVYQTLLQVKHQGEKYAIVNFSNFLILVLQILFFVGFLKMKAEGPLLATAITSFVFFIYALWDMRNEIKLGINLKYFKKNLYYCLPILPHNLTGWTSALLDRILLNKFVSTSIVGIYQIGYSFGNLLGIVTISINQAYGPWFFEEMKNNKTDTIRKVFVFVMSLYITLASWVSLLSKDLFELITHGAFKEGWKVAGIIAFGNVFAGYYYFLVNPLFYNERGPRVVPLATVSGALLGVILNIILIKRYNIFGASIAMALTNIATAFLVGIFANRIQPIRWDHFIIMKIILYNVLLCVVVYYIDYNELLSPIWNIALKFIMVPACAFLNYYLCVRKYGKILVLMKLFSKFNEGYS